MKARFLVSCLVGSAIAVSGMGMAGYSSAGGFFVLFVFAVIGAASLGHLRDV